MESESSNESNLPWIWSIELLANNQRADFGTIRDVARKASGLSEGSAEFARELIALRCLEGFYKMGCENKGCASGGGSKIGLDLSQSASAVLHRLTKETGGIKPALAALDLTKWDIPAFVVQKRASLQKCTLLQMEEMIVEGTDPVAVSLRERSGRGVRDRNAGRGLLDGVPKGVSSECDGATPRHQVAGGESEKIFSSIPLNEVAEDSFRNTNKADLRRRDLVGQECILVSGSDHQSNAAKRSKEENHVDRNDLVSGIGDTVTYDQHGVTSPPNVGSDGGKVLQDYNLNKERLSEQSVPDALLHDGGFHNVRNSQKSLPDTSQNGDLGTAMMDNSQEKRKLSAEQDAPKTTTAYMQQTILPTGEEISITSTAGNRKVNGAVAGESRQKTARHNFQSTRKSCIVEDSQSEDKEDNNEEVEVASLKKDFLSLQSSTLEWSEPTLCVKCNKSGSLLCCSSAACPVAVHEDCLGLPPCYDDNGRFQCPFCVCFLANAAYLEAKKKVSIRKKELNTYLDSRRSCEFSDKVPDRRNKRYVKQNGLSDPIKSHDNEENGEMNKNQRNMNVDHSPRTTEAANISAREEPPVVCMDNNPADQEAGSKNAGHIDVIIRDGARVLCADDILPGTEKDTFQKPDNFPKPPLPLQKLKHQDCRAIVLYEGVTGTDKSDTVSQNPPEAKVMHARPIRSSPTTKISPQVPPVIYHAYPINRKRKVPWTAEEENKLKEGVRTFYKPEAGQKAIPWGQILEFGAVIFHPGRTAENLKDKWRNICKKGV